MSKRSELREALACVRGTMRCPVHSIPDCSPLLNGCSILARAHDALDFLVAHPACPIKRLLDESSGEWVKVVGTNDDGAVVDIHIVCKSVTAADFLPIVEEYERTFEDYV